MSRRVGSALLAGAAVVGALAEPTGAALGSGGCVSDTCAAGGGAGDRGDDSAALMQLRTGQRNASFNAKPVVTTSITESLMLKLKTGVLVRAPDHGVGEDEVPSTFWRQDIHVPNQFYMFSGDQGFQHTRAVLGYVVDPSVLGWKPETLYAHDANACDSPTTFHSGAHLGAGGRCTFMEHTMTWDCPGAVAGDCGFGPIQAAAVAGFKLLADAFEKACHMVGAPKVVLDWPSNRGAGDHLCRGCHFSQGEPGFKWVFPGYFDSGVSTVGMPWDKKVYQGRNCQCRCTTPKECEDLAERLVKQNRPDSKFPIDHHMCWNDNTDLHVAMQNALWDSTRKKDPAQASNLNYWGWSEVAAPKRINEPKYYAANMIYMTPELSNGGGAPQGLEALTDQLKKDLDGQVRDAATGKTPTIKVGSGARGQHPGSDVVIARQNFAAGKFSFEFFCQEYKGAVYQICAKAKTAADPGHCYLEMSSTPCV